MRARKPNAELLNETFVRGLLASQFPEWSDLPIKPVEFDGWDNTTFRLGEDMSIRLPTGDWYAEQVDKEHKWLPRLAPLLPLAIPVALAKGVPTADFPLPWSVYTWIDGEIASRTQIDDLTQFAETLAAFLVALQRIPADGGPSPGRHNFNRGIPLTTYDPELPHKVPGNWGTKESIEALRNHIDVTAATEVWESGLESEWEYPPVWIHGDIAPGNLLVRDGRLSAVIDFGCSAVGDPACDLVIAWSFFSGESRTAFREGLKLDDATWARARAWGVWWATMWLEKSIDIDPQAADKRVIVELLTDPAFA